MLATQHIQKWGNSAGIRLPKKILEAAHLRLGQVVAIDLRGSSIVLTPVERAGTTTRQLPTLEALLDGVTPSQVGTEIEY